MNHKPLKADVDAFRSQVDDLLDSNFNTTFEDADKKLFTVPSRCS